MNESFDIIANLPAVIFALLFFVSFVLCLRGGIILLRRRPEKMEKGRKLLIRGIIFFFIIALVALVFYLVSYLLQTWYLSKAKKGIGEFPASASVNFPSSPEFLKIEGHYFRGPYSLNDTGFIEEKCVYAVLCPKEEGYDKIYIGEGSRIYLKDSIRKACWLENCDRDLEVAILWTPINSYSPAEAKSIRKSIEEKVNPPCLEK